MSTAAAVGAIAAAAAAAIVAAAYALFALLRDPLGPAGASAVVAAVFALVALVGALLLTRRAHPHHEAEPASPLGRALDIARERPVLAAAAAVAAGLVALRNPKIMAAVVSAFVAGRTAQKH